ncbi:MAG: bifunctional precorrin-2 dehydrogenase/sirohydrochlorin ferrochelatase, partial [Gammaproteobacteria bacterium]
MDALPIFLKLKGTPTLVVGGGDVAERKIDLLLRAGASVTVISPTLCEAVTTLHDRQLIHWIAEPFDPKALARARIVIAATDDRSVNQAVYEAAGEKGIPVNVVDQPDLCTFTVPSIVD